MTKEKIKEKPKQSEGYDPKLAIKGTFEEVIRASFVKDKKPNKAK
jgi:hypothetical protein